MVVVDNTALSTLVRNFEIDVLNFLFDEIIVPLNVQIEFSKKWDVGLIASWEIIDLVENYEGIKDYPGLSKADFTCLLLAKNKKTGLVTDDLKLRGYCENEGIAVMGTIGILRSAFNRGYFKDPEEYKRIINLIAGDLYLSNELIDWALKL